MAAIELSAFSVTQRYLRPILRFAIMSPRIIYSTEPDPSKYARAAASRHASANKVDLPQRQQTAYIRTIASIAPARR